MEKEFEKEVLERLTRIETKIDDYDRTKTKSEEARAKSLDNERRINDLEDKLKWITRTILGGLITSGISIVIIFVKIGLNV